MVVIGSILLFVDGLRHYTRCKPRLCTTGCTASKQYRSHTTVWKPARHRGENPQTSEPDPTLSNIQVIQVKDIMIPGDTITEDNVQAAEISAADYELLRANGRILYQWETVNNLLAWSSTSISRRAGTSPPVMRVRHTHLLLIPGSMNRLG